MSYCQLSYSSDGEHRWEYFGVQQGEEWDRCMDCGEARLSGYHDTGSRG